MHIPPLRERPGDIPHLVREFLAAKIQSLGLNFRGGVSEKEIRRLYDYSWPGNVRELEHVVERSLIMHDNDKGTLHFVLPDTADAPIPSSPAPTSVMNEPADCSACDCAPWPTLKDVEDNHIRETLKKTGGTLLGPNGAATLLGIHYSTLRSKMKHMGLPLPREAQKKTFS